MVFISLDNVLIIQQYIGVLYMYTGSYTVDMPIIWIGMTHKKMCSCRCLK